MKGYASASKATKTMLFGRIVTLFLVVLVILTSIFYEFYNLRADSDRVKLGRADPTNHGTDSRHFFLLNETLSSLKSELLKVHAHQNQVVAANNLSHDSSFSEFEEKMLNITFAVKTVVPGLLLEEVRSFTSKRALLYTMDSIKAYESASEQGGAAGEILVRSSLEKMFGELNVLLEVKGSDLGAARCFIVIN